MLHTPSAGLLHLPRFDKLTIWRRLLQHLPKVHYVLMHIPTARD